MATDKITSPKGSLALVGDFGGTHVRLALADIAKETPVIRNIQHYLSKDFARAEDTIAAYLASSSEKPGMAVIAAAGPVIGGAVRFTNLGWSLSEAEIRGLGLTRARIINDYVAAAFSTQLFAPADLHKIGPGAIDRRANAAIMGPGTGFGASALVMADDGRAVAMAAEGGHATFAPEDDVELEIARVLMRRYGHVSVERVLSGPGLINLHQALNAIEGVSHEIEDAEDITRQALANERYSRRTVERFCAILGAIAGNLALTYGATGGVFVAGGIAPGILPILDGSRFRERFEAKGRFAGYLSAIATSVIIRTDAAFLGAAQVARTLLQTQT